MDVVQSTSTNRAEALISENRAAAAEAEARTQANAPPSSDFETFLKMLTAQIQNQDPLNPIDSTDYAVQLATFSSVEQQVLTNDLLETMTPGGPGLGTLTELAGWIGMEARVAGRAPLSGDGVVLSFEVPPDLEDTAVEIRNVSGDILVSLPVSPGETSVFWDGRNADGARLPDGSYDVALTGSDVDGEIVTADVSAFVRVAEVQMGPTGGELRLSDGRMILPESVTSLREAV
ncbi:MAG: flagellar hook capping FlgD N-terminal domain-containing protein [Pseudomonadota bacterium]